ncbi:MAG: hypothetical protein JO113_09165 [Candidatus Eremiobacteraeota bacterium]|nr:hypothetical protein [Candidatus Eremiobacteraeota bacterium]
MELRPLDFGGILERATVLYVRNFARLAGVAAVAIVPAAIVQYFVLLGERPQLEATLDVLQHPDHLRTQHVPSLFDSPLTLAAVIGATLLGYYLLAFAFGALAASVQRLYNGEDAGFRAAYEPVLRRWTSLVVIVGCAILALIANYLAIIVIGLIPLLAAAAFRVAFVPVVTLVTTAIVFLIAFALLCILAASSCAICAVVIERCSASWALRLTVGRIFNRLEFGRSLLCAFAVAAIGLILSTIVDMGALPVLSRWPLGYTLLDAAERVVLVPFLALVLIVYYFDIRLRYEGFDLEVDRELSAASDEPVYAPTAYLSGEERALVKRFLERRNLLSPARRRELAAQLAAPARARVPVELRTLDDESLLERL